MRQKMLGHSAIGVLLRSLVAVIALGAAEVSVAGVLDLFFGSGPALERRMKMGAQGLALREDVRIREYCTCEFDLRLIHKRMGELDALMVDRAFPIAVTVDVFRYEDGHSTPVARLNEIARLSGRGAEATSFLIGHMRLDEGRHRGTCQRGTPPRRSDWILRRVCPPSSRRTRAPTFAPRSRAA